MTAIKKARNNITQGWRTTIAGVLLIALSAGYYWQYEVHLFYCVSGVLTGLGFMVAPDDLRPIFVGLIKSVFGFFVSKLSK